MSTPDKALHDLFVAHFTADQLRRLLTHLHGPRFVADLPGASVSLNTLAFEAAQLLHRRRLVGAPLFEALAAESPAAHGDICGIAEQLGIPPPAPLDAPRPVAGDPPFVVDWPRLATFKGRDALLEELHRSLARRGDRVRGHAMLRGLGGMGKTQLAVEYAYRYHRHYAGGVYWIDGARSWKDELAAVAVRLGLTPPVREDSDQSAQWVMAFERHLRAHGGDALIVLDNVEAPQDVVRREIAPKLTMATLPAVLLMTTRLWELPPGFTDVPLHVLPLADARAILREADGERASDAAFDEICQRLGCLPLAIALAAAALKKLDDMPIDSFLAHLRRSGIDLLADEAGVDPDAPGLHQTRVNAVLDWHWGRITDDNARELLALAAAYPGDAPLPLARLRVLSGLADDPRDLPARRPFKRAIDELLRTSMIRIVEDRPLRLHSLVREYVRRRLDCMARLIAGAERMLAAYRTPEALDVEASERLLDALVGDLRDTAAALPPACNCLADVQRTAWLFGLESHHLPRSGGDTPPAYVIQHIRERAHHQRDDALRAACDAWLTGKPHLRSAPAWRFPVDPALLRVFEAHDGPVNRVAVSPCGTRALSASSDKTLRIWDLESGDTLRVLAGHEDVVTDVIALPDGRRALSASADQTLRMWDLERGEVIHVLHGHRRRIHRVAIFAAGRRALSASSDGTLRVWDLERGEVVSVLRGHADAVVAIAVLQDDLRAVSSAADRTLRLWDLRHGRLLETMSNRGEPVNDLHAIPGRSEVLAACGDKTIKIWDPRTNLIVRECVGHSEAVLGVSSLPDGRHALSVGMDYTVRLWDVERGQLLRTLVGHSGRALGAVALPDGRRAVSASWDHTLRLWDLAAEQPPPAPEGHAGWWVRGLAVFPGGATAVSASSDRTLRIWALDSGRALRTLHGHEGKVNGVAVSPDGRTILSVSADKTMRLWDADSGQLLRTFAGHEGRVNRVLALPGGKQALSASWDKTLRLWDLESGKTLRVLAGHTGWVTSVARVGGDRALSASADRTLRLWDLSTGRTLRVYEGHDDMVTCVVPIGDGRRALSGGRDATMRLWDLQSGRTLRIFGGHGNWLNDVVSLGDGRLALSAAEDRTLRLWHLESGVTRVILHLEETPHALAVVPGDRVLIGGASGKVRVVTVAP